MDSAIIIFVFLFAYLLGRGIIVIRITNLPNTSLLSRFFEQRLPLSPIRQDFSYMEMGNQSRGEEPDVILKDTHSPNAFKVVCQNCGKVEYKKSSKAKFCSTHCRMEYHKKK